MRMLSEIEQLPHGKRAGLDIGSRAAKLVVASPQGLIASQTWDSVPFLLGLEPGNGFSPAKLGLEPDLPLVVTGYGRAALPAKTGISEIRAHFQGALAQSGLHDFVLVELGGQDSKVVQVKNRRPMDFVTNDRCAAGTGRYLENMARLLDVGLDELSRADEDPVNVNNTCAIFGETEILGHLVNRVPLANIMAGVNHSVAQRVAQMVRRYRPEHILFCGGVAKNQAVARLIERAVGCEVLIPPQPQFNGAFGCCFEKE